MAPIARDVAVRSVQVARTRLAGTHVAKPLLGALELTLKLLEAGTRAQAPAIQLGPQESDALAGVAGLGPRQLELAARAHESNSTTEYAW